MKVLIIEDEAPAARQLMRLLDRSAFFEGEIVGPMATVTEARQHLQAQRDYDLIFMDIHLADGESFEIFEGLDLKVPLVFCTAYDQYALKAFKLNSVDYLLKPIEPAELDQALEKYRSLHPTEKKEQELSAQEILKLLQPKQEAAESYKERFLLKVGDRMLTRSIEQVLYFYFVDKACFLVDDAGRPYPVEYSLDQLEQMCDPQRFFRINRQYLVSTEGIADMRLYSGSRVKLFLKHSEDADILVSRDKTARFKDWLEA